MDSRNGDGDSDQVADRVFLETTRRFAAPRLAHTDVALALQLAQVSPGKPETSRCVGKIKRPGSLIPTSIIIVKFAGSSGPASPPAVARSSRNFRPVS